MSRRSRRRTGFPAFGWLLIAVVLIVGAVLWFQRGSHWSAPGPATKPVHVTIADGATLAAAARTLEAAGAIPSTSRFLRDARRYGSDDPIRAGEYQVPARASEADILVLLQGGKAVQRLVIVPEGMPSILVAERLRAQSLLSGPVADPLEGSVLPDGYAFEKGEPRAAVLKRMQAAMTATLDKLWAARKPATAARTKAQALILASIVEKETGLPAERRMVAAVYSNRLKLGMKLQADPTVIYPITHGKPLGRRIRRSELDAVNGYNTYAMTGLPQGPICNPGKASIAAVLDPAQTQALYFVAKGDGGHAFAATLAEHNANVQKWYAIRRRRGEM